MEAKAVQNFMRTNALHAWNTASIIMYQSSYANGASVSYVLR